MALKVDSYCVNHISQNFKSKNKHKNKKEAKGQTLACVISQNHKKTSPIKPVLKPEIRQDLIEITPPQIDSDIQKITDKMKTEHKNFCIGIIDKKLPDFIKYEPCPQVLLSYSNTIEKTLKTALNKDNRYDDNWRRRAVFYQTYDNTIFEVNTFSEFAYQDEKTPVIKLIKYKNGDIDYISSEKWNTDNIYYDSKKQEFSYEFQPQKELATFDKNMNPKTRKKERNINWDGYNVTITHTTLFGENGEMSNIEEAWDSYNKDKLIFYRKSEYNEYNEETSRIILDTKTGKFIKKGIDF